MSTIYASYGEWKYNRATVRARASAIISALKALAKEVEFDAIALSGTSGVWLGGILQAHPKWDDSLPILLIRKSGEESHGPKIEGRDCDEAPAKVVFVDDFVCSGATVRRVAESLHQVESDVVAVLGHCSLTSGSKPNRTALRITSRTAFSIPVYERGR